MASKQQIQMDELIYIFIIFQRSNPFLHFHKKSIHENSIFETKYISISQSLDNQGTQRSRNERKPIQWKNVK